MVATVQSVSATKLCEVDHTGDCCGLGKYKVRIKGKITVPSGDPYPWTYGFIYTDPSGEHDQNIGVCPIGQSKTYTLDIISNCGQGYWFKAKGVRHTVPIYRYGSVIGWNNPC